ncbi:MAG TPA: hypothetical protein VKX17_28145 [Planctomycetota bacterium]|nr:hypothetical protein [Planctomycetota bacterium]
MNAAILVAPNSIMERGKQMKRIRYEPKVKASIIAAVQEARKSGKSWAEALVAAHQAGYKGTVDSLTQFVAANNSAKKTAAVKKAMAKATPAVAKPAVKAPTVKTPAVKPPQGALDINALVHKAVTDAVVNALEALVARIKGGK